MGHPIQALCRVPRHPVPSLLVASAGAKLYSYSTESGQQLASWPPAVEADSADAAAPAEPSADPQGPPEKRRKVSESSAQAVESSKPNHSATSKPPAWTSIPLVEASANGEYVVAVTSEDKCIRVFQLSAEGAFTQLSERIMPKKACAILLIDEDRTIVTADKFGDVYSMPLLPGKEPYVTVALREKAAEIPSANNLTVHTKRNLEALQQQLKDQQDRLERQGAEKMALNFEHQLLLGHVSMLTDLAFASLPVDPSSPSSAKRTYLLSADRDEHIRVSRGPPQTHVIEKYCFGHTSYITKLCIPTWAPEYLISGGGDKYLIAWKWAEGRLLEKVPLVESDATVVVRGIWAVSGTSRIVLVALEGSPKLLCFTLESDGKMKAQPSIQASGNVLDVTTLEDDNSTVLVFVDPIREAGSTQTWRAEPSTTLVEGFRAKVEGGSVEWTPAAETIVAQVNSTGTSEVSASAATNPKQQKALNDALYGLGNLRKKGGEE